MIGYLRPGETCPAPWTAADEARVPKFRLNNPKPQRKWPAVEQNIPTLNSSGMNRAAKAKRAVKKRQQHEINRQAYAAAQRG